MTRRVLRAIERGCWIAALGALGWYAVVHADRFVYQAAAGQAFDRMVRAADTSAVPAAVPPAEPDRVEPLFGRLEIPRLGVAAIVRPGTDDTTLRRAVGHIERTGVPEAATGNVGLAAHRDTFFRPLRHIRPNDEVRVTTPRGEFVYRVLRTRVVDPEDVWVLHDVGVPVLTLVTCYPFDFIGSAPRRFVVRAVRVEARHRDTEKRSHRDTEAQRVS